MNWRWPLFVSYCFFLLYLSVGSFSIPTVISWMPSDKFIHLTLYVILGWLAQSALCSWRPRLTLSIYLTAVALTLSYGLFTELLQYFLPERSFDWLDLAMDTLGGGTGAFVYLKIRRGLRLTKH